MAVVPTTVGADQRRSTSELRIVAAATDAHLDVLLSEELRRWEAADPVLGRPLATLRRLVLHGGKRLRPAFCQWGFTAVGGDPEGPLAAALADLRSALELLHAFALAHDDVMDGSCSRRGRPTTHVELSAQHEERAWRGEARRFGESIAILVGDLGHTYAHRLTTTQPAAVAAVWAELETELVLGQYLDVVGTASGSVSLPTARRIAQLKSGRYTVARPLELGAALAGHHPAPPALLEYGEAVGLAFQLRDDLLGVWGSPEVTGKPVGDDLREGKPTALVAVARERADTAQLAVLDRIGHLTGDADVVAVQEVLEATGARRQVEVAVDELTERGAAAVRRPHAGLVPEVAATLAGFAVVLCERTS